MKKPDPKRRLSAARSKALGEALERATALALAAGGVIAHRIATPSKVVRGRTVYTEQVCGDFFGLTVNGCGVLVECKHRTGTDGQPRTPRPSDFEKHQISALLQWHERGGLAMVAYWGPGPRLEVVKATDILGRK